MRKTDRILNDAQFAKFIVALERESVVCEVPEVHMPIDGCISVFAPLPSAVFAGGVRLAAGANDIKALVEERDALREALERSKDERRAKVRVHGGKVTTSRDGVISVVGGTVTVDGPAQLIEVMA